MQSIPNKENIHSTTQFFHEITKESDRIFNYAIIGYFINGLFLSYFYDTWIVGIGVGGLCLTAYFVCKWLLPSSGLYQYVGAGILAIYMAQFIYQMHGLFEMHLWAFVASALLITYQNWKLFIPFALLIVIHHAGFAWLQYSGSKIYFTQLDYMDIQTFLFHAILAVLIIAICAYWAYNLSQKTIQSSSIKLKLETQLKNIHKNIQFAEEISKGNLTIAHDETTIEDELGIALLRMQQSLLTSAEREKAERFISDGISKIGEVLRNNINNLQNLTDLVLTDIIKILNINQGAIFLAEENQMNETVLVLKSCYAYDRKKYMQKEIAIGEGLTGQAYLEKEYIYMTEVPQGYTTITSGLGTVTPTSILIMPLINNEHIVGVLELASLKTIPENHIHFIVKAAESIASTIQSAQINDRTNLLLQQAQEQSGALRAQEEELRQNLEEMEATQEEISRKKIEFEKVMEEKNAEIDLLKRQLEDSNV